HQCPLVRHLQFRHHRLLVIMKFLILICALTVAVVVAQDKTAGCIDQVPDCPKWAADGECKKNPVWMKPNCPVSCELCDKVVKCVDSYKDQCVEWKKNGDCTSENRIWMFFNCPKACGTCGTKFTG
ncbi:unnamed protein product, partial [Meganyctiphanes norvegica]